MHVCIEALSLRPRSSARERTTTASTTGAPTCGAQPGLVVGSYSSVESMLRGAASCQAAASPSAVAASGRWVRSARTPGLQVSRQPARRTGPDEGLGTAWGPWPAPCMACGLWNMWQHGPLGSCPTVLDHSQPPWRAHGDQTLCVPIAGTLPACCTRGNEYCGCTSSASTRVAALSHLHFVKQPTHPSCYGWRAGQLLGPRGTREWRERPQGPWAEGASAGAV